MNDTIFGDSTDRERVVQFLGSGADRPTLGLVYGRRRIGKSTLLERLTTERHGFYWEATSTGLTRFGR